VKVLPVLDLRQGLCVRAVAGQRETYRPLAIEGLTRPTPLATARWYREHYGLAELYVADLSAIAGEPPAWQDYGELESDGFAMWLDAGIGSLGEWQRHIAACSLGQHRRTLVAGLESFASARDWETLVPVLATGGGCFSLDLRHGRLWTQVGEWLDWPPERFLDWVWSTGIRRVIVLDVGAVGVEAGPGALELCRYCSAAYPGLELISGGGVRGIDDLRRLRDAGCSAALVATALQGKRITRAELASL
jgi:phosphoribosylformimino-5-aminoimidazole carboxamide ribotide isomerase